MRPFDPRLLRYARAARWPLALTGLLGLVQAVGFIAFAWLLALGITRVIDGDASSLAPIAWGLCAAVAVRGLASWSMDAVAARAGALAKSELRLELVGAVARLGARRLGMPIVEATTLATHGLDALDAYFGKYLPQLLLTALVTPLLIVVTFVADPVSAITELVTLPIIPLFMALIGWATQRVQTRQLDALTTLARAFLDVVEGLSTLKIFGRAARQRERVRAITEDYRVATMKVLRLTFLSGFALELFASLAVALVAVQIGIRLIDREMPLLLGLFALILAPEVFAPIRQVGAQFHAAAEGVTAASRVFTVLERAEALPAAAPTVPTPTPAGSTDVTSGLEVQGLRAGYDDRLVLDGLDAVFPRGAVTAVTGPSGAGKSTLLAALRGAMPADGTLLLDGERVTAVPGSDRVAWMGQELGLIEGTVLANVALGDATPDDALAATSLAEAGLAVPLERLLGVGGAGLSGGQSQRVALARLLYRARRLDVDVVLADEPSSALNAEREAVVARALCALADEGRVVIVVSHRPQLVGAADRRHAFEPAEVPS